MNSLINIILEYSKLTSLQQNLFKQVIDSDPTKEITTKRPSLNDGMQISPENLNDLRNRLSKPFNSPVVTFENQTLG